MGLGPCTGAGLAALATTSTTYSYIILLRIPAPGSPQKSLNKPHTPVFRAGQFVDPGPVELPQPGHGGHGRPSHVQYFRGTGNTGKSLLRIEHVFCVYSYPSCRPVAMSSTSSWLVKPQPLRSGSSPESTELVRTFPLRFTTTTCLVAVPRRQQVGYTRTTPFARPNHHWPAATLGIATDSHHARPLGVSPIQQLQTRHSPDNAHCLVRHWLPSRFRSACPSSPQRYPMGSHDMPRGPHENPHADT